METETGAAADKAGRDQHKVQGRGGLRDFTAQVELLSDIRNFRDATEMRGQALNVAPIKSGARFDEVNIVLLQLALLHRLLCTMLLCKLC